MLNHKAAEGEALFLPQSPRRCFWVLTIPVKITWNHYTTLWKEIETVKNLHAIGTTGDQRMHHERPYNRQIQLQTWKSRDCRVPSPKDACKASETAFMSTPSGRNPKERKSFAKPRESRLTKCTSWKKQKNAELRISCTTQLRGGKGTKETKMPNGAPRERLLIFWAKSTSLS